MQHGQFYLVQCSLIPVDSQAEGVVEGASGVRREKLAADILFKVRAFYLRCAARRQRPSGRLAYCACVRIHIKVSEPAADAQKDRVFVACGRSSIFGDCIARLPCRSAVSQRILLFF